jgi:hypothetical protein
MRRGKHRTEDTEATEEEWLAKPKSVSLWAFDLWTAAAGIDLDLLAEFAELSPPRANLAP